MKLSKYLAILLLSPTLITTQSSFAENDKTNLNQKLVMYTKPAIVRIEGLCQGEYRWHPNDKQNPITTVQIDKNFKGTGFFINPDGYIVTSADVMEFEKDCQQNIRRNIKEYFKTKYARNLSDSYLDNSNQGTLYIEFDNHYVYYPSSPKRILDLENQKPEIITSGRVSGESTKINKDIALIKVSLKKAPALILADSSNVQTNDKVSILGYSGIANLKSNNKSDIEVSVQEGNISNPKKEIMPGSTAIQIDNLKVDQGITGSPVINKAGEVVGMMTYNKSFENAPEAEVIPIAIPSNTIREFIRQSGKINRQGETDQIYREGLQNFWKGKYGEANLKFVKLRGIFPFHSEADKLISEINQIKTNRWIQPWKSPIYLLALTLIVATVAYCLLKKQPKIAYATAGVRRRLTSSKSGNFIDTSSLKNDEKRKKCFLEMEYKGQIQRFQLHKNYHRLGRDPAWSDFEVPTSWEVISRHHSILQKEDNDYRIFDGDRKRPSRNGLWINDDFRVDPQDGYLLKNGDRLKIGQDAHEQILLTYYNPNSEYGKLKTTVAN